MHGTFLLDCHVCFFSPRNFLDIYTHLHSSYKLLYMVPQLDRFLEWRKLSKSIIFRSLTLGGFDIFINVRWKKLPLLRFSQIARWLQPSSSLHRLTPQISSGKPPISSDTYKYLYNYIFVLLRENIIHLSLLGRCVHLVDQRNVTLKTIGIILHTASISLLHQSFKGLICRHFSWRQSRFLNPLKLSISRNLHS